MKKITQLALMFACLAFKNFFFEERVIKKGTAFFLIALLLLLFTSCSNQKPQKKFKVGFSQCTSHDVWRQSMIKEMEREVSFHSNIDFILKEANLNSGVQVQQIQELVNQNIDLLIVSPNEAAPVTPAVDAAYKKGIPVIVVDRNILSKNYSAFIGADNYKIGLDAGAFANTLLKGKGNVIELSGLQVGSSADIGRHNGFTDFIKKYPGIKYITRLIGDWEEKPWDEKFETLLKSNPDVDLIYSQNDRVAFAAYKVCKKLGLDKKIKIIGIDGLSGENGGIDLVETGKLKASILYPTGGKEAIQTAVNILEKKPYKKENDLSTTIIDSTNVTIMRLQNEKLLLQQEDIDERQKKIDEQITISRNQTNIITAISVTLALALIFGAILFYYLQENKKINKELELQKEEILSQRNQLIELGKKAKEATDAKFNFFTNISHELRTPLTLILGPLEDVLSSPKLPFSAKVQLEMVKKNAMRLLRLVNQLMDFRKIEEAKMKLRACENNITEFITEITNAFSEITNKKKISFRVDSKDKDLKVWFDVNMLDKVLFNILSNAFKYTNDHGSITVTVDKDAGNKNAIIKIEDTGIGMGPETLEHAFDLFYQGNESTYKGTGLGMALSKELITLHHGSINIKSEKWKGAAFQINLPLGKKHLDETEIAKEAAPYYLNYEDAKIYINEAEALKLLQQEDISADAKDYSILLIEDNTEIRTFLKNQLSKSYEIIEAENGNVGLNLAYEIVPDIIISDILLPGKDGMLITETLKNDIRTSHIPIIILTAKGSVENQIEGLKLNADAYIVKPFNLQFLRETIKGLLRNREALKGHYTGGLPNEYLRNSSAKKIDRKFVSEFSSIVENNIANEDFSVNDIYKELGISRVQLYRKVKAVLGYNVNDYILDVRMQKAKYLLLNEDLSISEIAFKTGFSSSAYFSTVFKSKFGVTPSDYKSNKIK
jgi:signal transduction histidine kinase/DNA-binding response OmpR family regulator